MAQLLVLVHSSSSKKGVQNKIRKQDFFFFITMVFHFIFLALRKKHFVASCFKRFINGSVNKCI